MKIAIPVNNNAIDSGVCISFGRAPYFMIYDNATSEYTFLENTAAENQGGAGIKAAQIVVDSKAEVLLTPRAGENAAKVIEAANITMYHTIDGSIQDNLDAFQKGTLAKLTQIHSGFHGHHGG